MNVLPSLPPSPQGNLHYVADRAVRAMRRATPGRSVHLVMNGDGEGVRDEAGLLMAIGIMLGVAADGSESDILVSTRAAARLAMSIEIRVENVTTSHSLLSVLDLHVARQIIERNGGSIDMFEDGSTRTVLASIPRITS